MQIADRYSVGENHAANWDIPKESRVELKGSPIRGFVYALFFEAVFVAVVYLVISALLLL